jgi:pyridoxal phosphate enzyme (YggS family)
MLIPSQISLAGATAGQRLEAIRGRIATAARQAGRDEHCVTLLAVSKGHGAASVRAFAAAGQRDFGENYLKEALPKMDALADLPLSWHFIGALQANKTRAVAERFQWVHGVDRLRVAQRLSGQRPFHAPPLNVCLQVKVADDPGKGGVAPGELPALAAAVAALPRLALRGLMCMLPEGLEPARQQALYAQVHALGTGLAASGLRLDTLSMGMSGDLEAAVAAGSTLVRIGTALFGSRERSGPP